MRDLYHPKGPPTPHLRVPPDPHLRVPSPLTFGGLATRVGTGHSGPIGTTAPILPVVAIGPLEPLVAYALAPTLAARCRARRHTQTGLALLEIAGRRRAVAVIMHRPDLELIADRAADSGLTIAGVSTRSPTTLLIDPTGARTLHNPHPDDIATALGAPPQQEPPHPPSNQTPWDA